MKRYPTLFAAIALVASSLAWAVPTVSIDSPTSGATVDDDHATVTGVATAVGGGAGVDLMLVLDNSGSLSSNDPTRERFQAVRELMRSFGPNVDVQVGMVFFSSTASVDVSLSGVSTATAAIEQSIISHQRPSGYTAIGAGIQAATSHLASNGRSGASQVVLVFTDGRDTESSNPEGEAASAAAAGITVNVVGLGSDPDYQSDMQAIATAGGGVMMAANDADELIALFSSARIVGISDISVANETTATSASNVNITAGAFSAPVDLAVGENTIVVTAVDTNGDSSTAQVVVTRQDTSTPPVVPERRVKLRPQVLMAGFDPMLIDITDTQFNVVAVVREGAVAIDQVTLSENTGGFATGMNYAGDLANGDKVYHSTYVFARGAFAPGTHLANLFGSNEGEFNVTAIDQGQMSHSFPHLEYGNNPDITTSAAASSGTSYSSVGATRVKPQPLVVGFDPALLDYEDTSFDVKAIVRAGVTAIQSVTLRNGGSFAMAMTLDSTLANGDEMYKITYTFPRGSFPAGSFRNLFGEAQEAEFRVEVTDSAQQSHAFPALEVGNYPSM